MDQKVNIHVFYECKGQHTHEYPQILVPLQEPMKISIGKMDAAGALLYPDRDAAPVQLLRQAAGDQFIR